MPDVFDSIPSPIDDARGRGSLATTGAVAAPGSDPFADIPSPIDDAKIRAGVPVFDPKQQFPGHGIEYGAQELAKGTLSTSALPSEASGAFGYLRKMLPSYFTDPVDTQSSKDFAAKLEASQAQPPLIDVYGTGNSRLPTGSDVAGLTNKLGLNNLTPQSSTEGLIGAAARGVGSTIPTLVATGGAAIAPQLAAGAGGGLGSELASRLDPGSWWAPVIGGLVGGLGFGSSAQALSKMATARAAQAAVDQSARALADAKSSLTSPVASFDAKNAAEDSFSQAQQFHLARQADAEQAINSAKDSVVSAAQGQIDSSKSALTQAISDGKLHADVANSANSSVADAAIQQTRAAALAHAGDIGAKIEGLAASHGASLDLDDAGQVLQDRARTFLTDELPARESAAWAPVDQAIDRGTPTPITSTLDAIDRISARGGELASAVAKFSPNPGPALAKILAPFREASPGSLSEVLGEAPGAASLPDRIKTATGILAKGSSSPVPLSSIRSALHGEDPEAIDEALRSMHTSGDIALSGRDNPTARTAEDSLDYKSLDMQQARVLKPSGGTLGSPTAPSWQAVRTLRSSIGEAMSNPVVLRDIPRQHLEQLYATITDDLKTTAETHGVGDEFDQANKASRVLRGFAEGPLAKIIDGPKVSSDPAFAPGKVASSLLSSGRSSGQVLEALRSEPSLSRGVDELAAAHLRTTAGRSAAWTSLSPNAREALLPDAGERNSLDALLADKAAIPASQREAIAAIKATQRSGVQVPDIASITASHAATVHQAETTIEAAKLAHSDAIAKVRSAASDAIANAKLERDSALRAQTRKALVLQETHSRASDALTSAKAAQRPTLHNGLTYGLEGLVGGGIGEHVGEAASHLLGLTGLDPGVSALVGTIAPMAARAGRAVLTGPNVRNMLTGAAAGAATGQNALGPSARP